MLGYAAALVPIRFFSHEYIGQLISRVADPPAMMNTHSVLTMLPVLDKTSQKRPPSIAAQSAMVVANAARLTVLSLIAL